MAPGLQDARPEPATHHVRVRAVWRPDTPACGMYFGGRRRAGRPGVVRLWNLHHGKGEVEGLMVDIIRAAPGAYPVAGDDGRPAIVAPAEAPQTPVIYAPQRVL